MTHTGSAATMRGSGRPASAAAWRSVGTEAEVRDQLAEVQAVGVTDLNAGVFGGDPEESARTRAVLREFV